VPYSPLEMAEALIQSGELDNALEVLNEHLKAISGDSTARRFRAQIYAHQPDETSLRAALLDLAALSSKTAHDYILQSVLLVRLRQFADAIAALHEGHTRYPDDERLLERYVHLLRGQGEITRARALLADRLESWRWQQWAGDLAVDEEDFTAAIRHYNTALRAVGVRFDLTAQADNRTSSAIMPIYARLLLARADALLRLNQYAEADDDYKTAAELMPDDPVIPFKRGLLAAMRGEIEDAEVYCRAALAAASPSLCAYMLSSIETQPNYTKLYQILTND
jgi:tetratricopeptide (TPR) repeat protein